MKEIFSMRAKRNCQTTAIKVDDEVSNMTGNTKTFPAHSQYGFGDRVKGTADVPG